MSAYIIFILDKVKDQAALDAYRKTVPPTFEGHAVTRRAGGARAVALEGPPVESGVVLEFPTLEEARAWYDSPAYQAATQQRLKGGDYRVLIIEGA